MQISSNGMRSERSASYFPLNFSLLKFDLTAALTFGSSAERKHKGVRYFSFTKAHSDIKFFFHTRVSAEAFPGLNCALAVNFSGYCSDLGTFFTLFVYVSLLAKVVEQFSYDSGGRFNYPL